MTEKQRAPLRLEQLLKDVAAKGASDLHLKVDNYPMMRIHGDLQVAWPERRLDAADTAQIGEALLPAAYQKTLEEAQDLDFACSLPDVGRVRCSVFRQRGVIGLVLRIIQLHVKSFEELRLPPVIKQIAEERRGLVLVTGTTTSGKSTTLAAMIEHINRTRCSHIITIEDPIEFLHRDDLSVINQREVSLDTRSFAKALRSALRQDPDVIMVGEMRDPETIGTALLAAETGHLVFSTLHTVDAPETINRTIAAFPTHEQRQIRLQLANVLKAVISLRLLRHADGHGRVPAAEILIATSFIRDCIADPDKSHLIPAAIAAGEHPYGMQTFDQSILALYRAGLVTREEALQAASNPDDLTLKIVGIESGSVPETRKDRIAAAELNEVVRFGR